MTSPDPELLLSQTGWLRRLAAQIVGDRHVVEDVLQDTWLAALERPPRNGQDEGTLRSWLGRVAGNAARMRRRGDRRRLARERSAARAEAIAPAVDEPLAAHERLLAAIRSLPPAEREVVVLRWFEDLPPRAIARRLGQTGDAVRSRLARALAALRVHLGARDGDRRALALALLPLLDGRGATALGAATGLLLMKTTTKILSAAVALVLGVTIALLVANGKTAADGAGDATGTSSPAVAAADAAPAPAAVAPAADAPVPEDRRSVVATPAPPAEPEKKGRTVTATARCVDGRGVPIAGARLIAIELASQAEVICDANGMATMVLDWPQKMRSGNPHWLEVVATGPGLTRQRRQEKVAAAGDATIAFGDLVLVPGGSVGGLVLGEDGAPATGAAVFVVQGATPSSPETEELRRVKARGFDHVDAGQAWARTDASGRYLIEGIPVGSVSVVTRSGSSLNVYTPPLAIVAGGCVEAPVLRLRRAAKENLIAGRVFDADGAPVAARVAVYEHGSARNVNPEAESQSSATGGFEVLVLSGRRYALEIALPGTPSPLVIEDVAAGTTDLEARFSRPRILTVVVTGPGGAPVPRAFVQGVSHRGMGLRLKVDEEPQGTFAVTAPSEVFALIVGAPGCRVRRSAEFEPAAAPERLAFELEPAPFLGGRVVAAGKPVAGAQVHVHVVDPHASSHRFVGDLPTRLQQATPGQVKTDADGLFQVTIHAAGRYVLHAEAPGWGRGESSEVAWEERVKPATVEIELPEAAAIEGRVLSVPGIPGAGQPIVATSGDGHAEVCVSDAEGRFRFAGLAPGGWLVRACEPDQQDMLREGRTWSSREDPDQPVDVRLASGQTATFDVDLRSRYAAEILGRVALAEVASGGWGVGVWCDRRYSRAAVALDGSFAHRCAAGDAVLTASGKVAAGGTLELCRSVRLQDGRNAIDFEMQPGSVEIADLPPSAPPPRELQLAGYALVWTARDGIRCTYRFDPDGSGGHRVAALPAGHFELRRREREQQQVEAWAKIAEGDIVAGGHVRVVPK